MTGAVYAPQNRPAHKGFSIVDLMIAVAIVADLAVIAVPSFVPSREIGAERALCE
jgi:Tfp pilus assembly protein PilE